MSPTTISILVWAQTSIAKDVYGLRLEQREISYKSYNNPFSNYWPHNHAAHEKTKATSLNHAIVAQE